MIESFWSRMQVELLDRRHWQTRVELANAIFEYLEIFHNRQRRHSALGMLTPIEFEARHQSSMETLSCPEFGVRAVHSVACGVAQLDFKRPSLLSGRDRDQWGDAVCDSIRAPTSANGVTTRLSWGAKFSDSRYLAGNDSTWLPWPYRCTFFSAACSS